MQVRRKVFSYAVNANGDVRLFSTANVAGSGYYQKNFGFSDRLRGLGDKFGKKVGSMTTSLARALGSRSKDVEDRYDVLRDGDINAEQLKKIQRGLDKHANTVEMIKAHRADEYNQYLDILELNDRVSPFIKDGKVIKGKEADLAAALGYGGATGVESKLAKQIADLNAEKAALVQRGASSRELGHIESAIASKERALAKASSSEYRAKSYEGIIKDIEGKVGVDQIKRAKEGIKVIDSEKDRWMDDAVKGLQEEYGVNAYDAKGTSKKSGALQSKIDKAHKAVQEINDLRDARGAKYLKVGAPIAGGLVGAGAGYGIGSYATRNMDPEEDYNKIKAIKIGSTLGGAALGAAGGHYGAKYGLSKSALAGRANGGKFLGV